MALTPFDLRLTDLVMIGERATNAAREQAGLAGVPIAVLDLIDPHGEPAAALPAPTQSGSAQ
jgi:P2-related tail formation protein